MIVLSFLLLFSEIFCWNLTRIFEFDCVTVMLLPLYFGFVYKQNGRLCTTLDVCSLQTFDFYSHERSWNTWYLRLVIITYFRKIDQIIQNLIRKVRCSEIFEFSDSLDVFYMCYRNNACLKRFHMNNNRFCCV